VEGVNLAEAVKRKVQREEDLKVKDLPYNVISE